MRPVVRRKMGYWLFPPPSAHDLGSGNVFADLNLPRRGATAWSIAVRLNALLKAEGLTQAAAAKHMGVARPHVSSIGVHQHAGQWLALRTS